MSIVPTDLPIGAPQSRRRFLQITGITAAGALVVAACSSDEDASAGGSSESSSGDLTSVALQLSWLPDTEFAPIFIADDKGYFEDAGVEVEMIPGGPDIGAIEAIVGSGAADIGIATDIFSVIAAQADGSPFVVIGGLYQANLHGFISPQDAPITEASQLAGKRLGASQGTQPKFEAILSLAGEDPTNYTFVPAGFGPDLVINGEVDAQSVFITDEVIAYRQQTGEEPVLLTWDEVGLPSFTLVFFTTQEYLDNNRDAVKGFLKAVQQGQVDNEADPELGATLAAEEYGKDAGLELELEKLKNVEYLKYANSDATEANGYLYIDPAFVESDVFAGMQAADMKTGSVDEVIDMSLLEEIKAEG
jgi:ABC-type nitrate/sulfonate/bicarbonate transport system substrate-binding protein